MVDLVVALLCLALVWGILSGAMSLIERLLTWKRSRSMFRIYKFYIGSSERLVQPEKPGQPAIWASDCMAIGVGHTEVEAREAIIAYGMSQGWEWRWLRVASVTVFEITPRWVCWVMGN
jgi:hypothetical protein